MSALSEIISNTREGTGNVTDVLLLMPLIDYLSEKRDEMDRPVSGFPIEPSTVKLLDVLRGLLAERWYVL